VPISGLAPARKNLQTRFYQLNIVSSIFVYVCTANIRALALAICSVPAALFRRQVAPLHDPEAAQPDEAVDSSLLSAGISPSTCHYHRRTPLIIGIGISEPKVVLLFCFLATFPRSPLPVPLRLLLLLAT